MDHFLFIEFFPACLLMGLAIGIDAAIATSVNGISRRPLRQQLYWLWAISTTHTLFPLLGYALSYSGNQYFPVLSPLIGLLAFALIAHFLWQELRQPNTDTTRCNNALVSIGLILAVSWDALWSGPAKSAQVIHWPDFAIWASFMVVGLTVTALIGTVLVLAKQLQVHLPGTPLLLAQWLQYSAISYFGWLALVRYTLGWSIPWPYLLLFALLVMLVVLPKRSPAPAKAQLSY